MSIRIVLGEIELGTITEHFGVIIITVNPRSVVYPFINCTTYLSIEQAKKATLNQIPIPCRQYARIIGEEEEDENMLTSISEAKICP